MSLLELEFLFKAVEGSYLQKGVGTFSGVGIDSRKAMQDKVFFAIKGLRFDGHDFLDQAVAQGAKAFILSDKSKAQKLLENKKLTVILVPDTLKALQSLAHLWTKKLKTKVVAITGSNGKTTTKTFTEVLCSGHKPFASPKSYNNAIGVSLSLLAVNRKESFLIQEIGTNHLGEIAHLTSMCEPFVSAVTMIGPSHLEGLGDLESIAKEKQDIYLKSQKATWVFNRDNSWTKKMFQQIGSSHSPILSFSSSEKPADVSLRFVKEEAQSSLIEGHIASVKSQARLSFAGTANLENLMCACALALAVGVKPQKIWELIPQCALPEGRQEYFQIKDKDISILFDAYNANPSSMNFFLKTCEKLSQAHLRLLVLGDMKELGKDSKNYHKDLAVQKALLESRFVAYVGEYAGLLKEELKQKGFKGHFVSSDVYDNKILSAVKAELKAKDFLAIKASRSLKLERLLFDLTGRKIL